jgi:hypothetical protein
VFEKDILPSFEPVTALDVTFGDKALDFGIQVRADCRVGFCCTAAIDATWHGQTPDRQRLGVVALAAEIHGLLASSCGTDLTRCASRACIDVAALSIQETTRPPARLADGAARDQKGTRRGL